MSYNKTNKNKEIMDKELIEINGIKYLLNEDGTACVTGVNKDFWEEEKVECLTIPKEVECEGAMYGITKISHEAFRYSGLRSVAIPEGVTEVGHRAFFECGALLSVSIPASVAKIGNDSFRGCDNLQSIEVSSENKVYSSIDGVLYNKLQNVLIKCPAGKTSVNIPDSVRKISSRAFYGCRSLLSVAIPDGVIEISNDAFRDSGLLSVVIPKSVRKIGNRAFVGCSLTSIAIPVGVAQIGEYAFSYCEKLTSITIPDSVTKIGKYAFGFCSSLTEILLGNNVTEIGDDAFNECESLQSIEVSPENKMYYSFDGVLYNKVQEVLIKCPTGKTSVNISASVRKIGNRAFYGCRGLSSVAIPNGVTIIGDWAFAACERLLSITIPDSVTIIGDIVGSVFYHCSSLTSIVIPEGVTQIGYDAFRFCESLQSIEVKPKNKVYSSFEGVLYNKSGDVLIMCPAGKTNVNIPEGVTAIGLHAFYECNTLTSVVIPDSVTEIKYGAFKECRGLTSVAIPESVRKIGRRAFYECNSLTSVVIPEGVTEIGYDAFCSCKSLQSIDVSSENKMYSSFEGVLYNKGRDVLIACPAGKTNVNIADSVTKIGGFAFYDCRGLSSISIPESVAEIGYTAFWGCSGLTSVVCLAKEPPATGLYVMCNTLRVPAGCCETYRQSKWGERFERIEEVENDL